MYEKLTWKPLETNSLADILTMQTECTQTIIVVPAYTPAVVTIGTTNPSASSISLAPNKALIPMSVAWTVILNNDTETRGHIKITKTVDNSVVYEVFGPPTSVGATSGSYAITLPLSVVTADTNVYVTLGVDTTKDGISWNSFVEAITYTSITLLNYISAVITNVVEAQAAKLVKGCGNPLGLTYTIVLNHDIKIEGIISLTGTVIDLYVRDDTVDGDTGLVTNLANAKAENKLLGYSIDRYKPDGGFSTAYYKTYANKLVLDKVIAVHKSCGVITSPIVLGQDILTSVVVTGGNCSTGVYFKIWINLSFCTATSNIYVPGNEIDNTYPITIPTSCLPEGPQTVKIEMIYL